MLGKFSLLAETSASFQIRLKDGLKLEPLYLLKKIKTENRFAKSERNRFCLTNAK